MQASKPLVKLVALERGSNGKLAVALDFYAPAGYVMGRFTSAHVFRSYGAAIKGSRRALSTLARTGALPNMCEAF